jgi:hypothetical protein
MHALATTSSSCAAGGGGAAAATRSSPLPFLLHRARPCFAAATAAASIASTSYNSVPTSRAASLAASSSARRQQQHRRRSRLAPRPSPSSPLPSPLRATNSSGNSSNDDSSSSSAGEKAYSNLFNAKIFADPERQREFERCMTDLRSLSAMSSRFPEFDVAGKRAFLAAMSDGSERYKIFIARLELSKETDPAAAEYLRYTSAQMAGGGFSIGAMFEGLAQSLERYKSIADAEERAEAAGPIEAARFKAALRDDWGKSALGAIDMGQLAEMVSPEVIARAQADPDFYKAIKAISESPTPDVLASWISHERIGPLVTAMAKLLLQKQGLGGVGGVRGGGGGGGN